MRKTLHLGKNIILSNFKIPNKPYKLTYAITYNCNSRCKICNIWKKKSRNELKLEEIRKFFEKNNYFSWIDLTGGEPFIRKDLADIVKIIIKNCKNLYLIHLPTNGLSTKLIIEKSKQITSLKPKKFIISVSLDGPPELNDSLRIKNAFDNSIRTYKELKKIGIEAYFGMTLSNYNYDKFKETFNAVKKSIPDIKYTDFHMNISHYSPHFYSNKKERLMENEIIKEIDNFIRLRGLSITPIKWLERRYLKLIEKYLKTKKVPVKCLSLSSSIFMDPYGNIYPCSIYNKKLGNLKDFNYSLKDIWKSGEINKIRNQILKKQCPNCWTPCEAYQSILGNLI